MMCDVNSGNGGLYRIDGDGVLKVGDFGLSENVYGTGYFRLDKGSSGVRLPFKWLAPESFRDGVFNEKTDVVGFFRHTCRYLLISIQAIYGHMHTYICMCAFVHFHFHIPSGHLV